MKKKRKRKGFLRPGAWIDEHGYYRTEREDTLADDWYKRPKPLPAHRVEFLHRQVARAITDGGEYSAGSILNGDLIKIMAERERLLRENKKLTKKVKRLGNG